jgi:hypothetical protein
MDEVVQTQRERAGCRADASARLFREHAEQIEWVTFGELHEGQI